jgi:DNA polymerase III gamma/tau subunit
MSNGIAEKYRPKTLDKIIGHEQPVTRLKGIIKSKKYPPAILFAGPSSAGKTTLARAFASDLFGVPITGHSDYHESNASEARGIDDVRQMINVSRLKPRTAPRRVFMVDEAQGFTGPAAGSLLKPLENPPPFTMWILGSMEPEKLSQAMKNRCSQFVLRAPEKEHLVKYVKRIVKGEEMSYMLSLIHI